MLKMDHRRRGTSDASLVYQHLKSKELAAGGSN